MLVFKVHLTIWKKEIRSPVRLDSNRVFFVTKVIYNCDKIKKRTISDAPPTYLNLKTHEQNKNTKIFHIAIRNTEKVYIFA